MNYTQLLEKSLQPSEFKYEFLKNGTKRFCFELIEASNIDGTRNFIIQREHNVKNTKRGNKHSIGFEYISEKGTDLTFYTYGNDESFENALATIFNTFGNLTPRF